MRYSIIKMYDHPGIGGRDFVGISNEIDTGGPSIVVPYGVNLPSVVENNDKSSIRFLRRFIKVIQKALRSNYVKQNVEEATIGIQNPTAAVNLIQDFLSNGPLIEFDKKEEIGETGSIDFNKTVKKITPRIVNDDLIFDSFVVHRKVINNESFVALVQNNVINDFMSRGGDILFGRSLSMPSRDISLNQAVVSKLRRELNNTYNSRKQSIIRWCIQYIRGIENINKDKGKWDYAIIASTLWEVMIDSVFGNQEHRNKTLYGKSYSLYSIHEKHDVFTGSPTEHDTIYEDDDLILIIDAKMYGWQTNLVNEDVLGKQFGYYMEAKKKNPHKVIVNILFLPQVRENLDSQSFQDEIILDPHTSKEDDPNKIIFIYKYPVDQLVNDYYLGKKRFEQLKSDFANYVRSTEVKKFLKNRGSWYINYFTPSDTD